MFHISNLYNTHGQIAKFVLIYFVIRLTPLEAFSFYLQNENNCKMSFNSHVFLLSCCGAVCFKTIRNMPAVKDTCNQLNNNSATKWPHLKVHAFYPLIPSANS